MSITCPCCGAELNMTLRAVHPGPSLTRSDQFVTELLASGSVTTARDVATAVAGRIPTPAEVEQARRQLARLVADGGVQVSNRPTAGGRPLAVYTVAGRVTTTRPTTG